MLGAASRVARYGKPRMSVETRQARIPVPTAGDAAPHLPRDASAFPLAQPAAVPMFAEPPFERLLPDSALACRLRMTPAAVPCSAVLTGLAMLAREGRIRLEVEFSPDAPPLEYGSWHLRDKQRPQAVLEVDGGGTAVIDGHDSWEIETQDLLRHDLYFKRSLRPESLRMPRGERLRPLGLLNEVRTDFADVAELRSELAAAASAPQRTKTLLRWLAWQGASRLGLGGRPNWSRMHAPPTPGQPQRVLLMAGLWDPDDAPTDDHAQRADREAINRQRVDCIRALRRAFGARFHGGVRPGEFARRYAPDVMLRSERMASRREFLRQVREHAVCVTSLGVNGSNGFRLAEFVAFSRAIVCEPLRYALPGGFAPGAHYLEYRTPEECVARVARLFDRPQRRDEMAQRNWDWYLRWQQPDRLALRLVALTWAARGTGGRRDARAAADQDPPSTLRAASS